MKLINNSTLGSIERVLNRLLNDDLTAMNSLKEIQGKCIQIQTTEKKMDIYVLITQDGLKMLSEHDEDADVMIKGTLRDMVSYMFPGSKHNSQNKPKMEVTGDVGLAQDFQNIMKNIDIDPEEYLSMYVGDIAAHKMGNVIRSASGFMKHAGNKLRMDINEYLIYEKKVLVSGYEMNEFISEIDLLREDVDRLEKRIERLNNRNQD